MSSHYIITVTATQNFRDALYFELLLMHSITNLSLCISKGPVFGVQWLLI